MVVDRGQRFIGESGSEVYVFNVGLHYGASMSGGREFWRPEPGSRMEARVQFVGSALSIVTATVALAVFAWSVISSNDGRMKALLLWAIGTSIVFGFMTLTGLQTGRIARPDTAAAWPTITTRITCSAMLLMPATSRSSRRTSGRKLLRMLWASLLARSRSQPGPHVTPPIKSVLGPQAAVGGLTEVLRL